ncbi:hypothetical protein MUBE_11055 [Mycobacterium uberis]|uniref:PE domain-containing protein n=1 Tax=Mycobacterium uberis TaxID=2162698 RepID=A0A3E1HFG8_9MYCO|nr:PE family protein [Mycobacterium uberis]RFD25191.1 hypothetical protein MUBE_11055 [Mycobacterium uberis]
MINVSIDLELLGAAVADLEGIAAQLVFSNVEATSARIGTMPAATDEVSALNAVRKASYIKLSLLRQQCCMSSLPTPLRLVRIPNNRHRGRQHGDSGGSGVPPTGITAHRFH